MSDFEINLTDVEELDSSSIGPMPAGDYEMIAQTWEAKKSKATNHRMINITFEVIGPQYAGRKVWENFMLEGNGLNVSKGKIRNWRKSMALDPDVENFNLEALETMMNVPFDATLKVEVGGDKGDGTKWDDKNVIAKFNTKTATATPTPSPTPTATAPETPAPVKPESSNDDGFDWDK
jgi:hypothetical protein